MKTITATNGNLHLEKRTEKTRGSASNAPFRHTVLLLRLQVHIILIGKLLPRNFLPAEFQVLRRGNLSRSWLVPMELPILILVSSTEPSRSEDSIAGILLVSTLAISYHTRIPTSWRVPIGAVRNVHAYGSCGIHSVIHWGHYQITQVELCEYFFLKNARNGRPWVDSIRHEYQKAS